MRSDRAHFFMQLTLLCIENLKDSRLKQVEKI
jgi:hypothetical protein